MVTIKKTNVPHIEWIDLKNNGMMVECAVMKRDNNGNIYHIALNTLDNIDRNRMANIVTNRNAGSFELWDLMSQTTLGNGVNALKYFHQLVKVLTASGQIVSPSSGQIGYQGTSGADTSVRASWLNTLKMVVSVLYYRQII
jgi:hypothetical protein